MKYLATYILEKETEIGNFPCFFILGKKKKSIIQSFAVFCISYILSLDKRKVSLLGETLHFKDDY